MSGISLKGTSTRFTRASATPPIPEPRVRPSTGEAGRSSAGAALSASRTTLAAAPPVGWADDKARPIMRNEQEGGILRTTESIIAELWWIPKEPPTDGGAKFNL